MKKKKKTKASSSSSTKGSSALNEMDAFVLEYYKDQSYTTCVIENKRIIQRLWSGYGEIVRYYLKGQPKEQPYESWSVIVKNVDPPTSREDVSLSHGRKIRSYQVETTFYTKYSSHFHHGNEDDHDNDDQQLKRKPRVPRLLCNQSNEELNHIRILLEDLNHVGYPRRQGYGSHSYIEEEVKPMIQWLAQFHGHFLRSKCEFDSNEATTTTTTTVPSYYPGLWEQGCYWYLDTRPDEFQNINHGHKLKKAAKKLDHRLKYHSQFITLLHGDAKICNFCFSNTPVTCHTTTSSTSNNATRDHQTQRYKVAAVDFQYCGAGIGPRDLAYMLHSCMDDNDLEQSAEDLLTFYFDELLLVDHVQQHFTKEEQQRMVKEWKELWPTCFADFERFLIGWSIGHESYGYSQTMIDQALKQSFDVDSID